MQQTGKYLTAILAFWVVLFVPLATSVHYHPPVIAEPGGGMVTHPPAGGHSTPAYPPCDFCLRLVVQAESFLITWFLPLSINHEIGFTSNKLPLPSYLLSNIGERGPPLTIG